MDNDIRGTDSAAATDAIRRKCYRGMTWGVALWVLALCMTLMAPLPLPMPGNFPALRPAAWWVVLGVFGVAGLLLLLGYGARLAPHAWGNPAGRSRARTWGLLLLGALTVAPLWAWGLALIVPAARRAGDRRAVWLAGAGGALGFAAAGILHLRRTLVATPWGWVLLTALFLSAALLWHALRRLDGECSRTLRFAGWGLVLAGAIAAFALPGWRVSRLAARADALSSSILATAGCADANDLVAAIPPPVAPDDDPLAVLDPDTLKADVTAWEKFKFDFLVQHKDDPQLAPADLDAIDASFAAHPVFVAAGEALTATGYHSSLPGVSSPRDLSPLHTPPRELQLNIDGMKSLSLLTFRARAACARGDIPAALADIRRLDNLAGLFGSEPLTIGQLIRRVIPHEIVKRILPERLDLWDDASLAALVPLLEAASRDGFSRYAQAMACELVGFEETLPEINPSCGPDLFRHPMRSPVAGPLARWLLEERIAYAEEMRRVLDTAAAIAAMLPGPDRAAAYAAFLDRQKKDEDRCTLLQSIFTPDFAGIFRSLVLEPEDDLLYLHAAAAVAAWHRDHGTLPPTLDGLLPYFPLSPFPFFAGCIIPPVYEPAPDGRSFFLSPPFPAKKENPIRFFLAPPPL